MAHLSKGRNGVGVEDQLELNADALTYFTASDRCSQTACTNSSDSVNSLAAIAAGWHPGPFALSVTESPSRRSFSATSSQ